MEKNRYYQVNSIEDNTYVLTGANGEVATLPVNEVDNNAKVFNIQDAKNGDVLYLQHDGKEHIIIYKGVIKERFRTFVSAYCAYNGIVDAFCFADVSRYIDIAYGGIMPATKIQRDLLFQKMREAGYEWDAEKKELKKIEQNPDWSEEDTRLLDNCISLIEDIDCTEEEQNWLKSLKDRYTWKPSDEQINALDIAIRCGIQLGTWEEEALKSLKEQLKKLREEYV